MTTTTSTPEAILDAVGGADNIVHLTHCATRLRFELHDASVIDKATVEAIPGVLGAVPQSGDRYQIVIGGAVQGVYTEIMNLPAMKSAGAMSDADVKAAARSKARGKNAIIDAFFEYLSDSFRPLLPVLLGASLIIAFEAMLDALGVVDFRDDAAKGATWVFVDSMWRSVFYFLPIMVAYNAAKKLNIDPWVGTAVMTALLTPNFMSLSSKAYTETAEGSGMFTEALKFSDQVTCTTNHTLGTESCVAHIFGLPMQLNDYGGQVFVPLIMVAVLAPLYKGLQKLIPVNLQMVFVPFLSFVVMMPVTAFLLGPIGVWAGSAIGAGLAWLNNSAPIVFAIVIPLLYPFLVPLGLHWPLNALMLINIDTLGYDFIQGPMGTWNFACFGATAGVLVLAIRDKDRVMRQTASGALAAGLLGGISEPSLYGIHLRFKRIYPRMLVGCAVGGLIVGIGGGLKASTFVFTSLLTIPVFSPMFLYVVGIAAAFLTAMTLIILTDYRTKEERAAAMAAAAGGAVEASAEDTAADLALEAGAAGATGADDAAAPEALEPGAVTEIASPLAGDVMALADVPDPVFSTGAVGDGAGVTPSGEIVVTAPAAGTVVVAPASGHAYGINLDNGVELLIHVGIDTVNLEGKGFDVKVEQGDRVEAGQELVRVDRAVVEEAGYSLTTPVLVTNTAKFASVELVASGGVEQGAALLRITAKD
ncbi:phosphotransferase system, EIIC [Actinomyces sp. Chiba101]|uniref:PTS system, beta-glucosides-specific IIC component n=1 Tax=Actinomyces denticolens TaxID=52767 RepID=A0ABY1I730_9ACTO|nr:MULTISPECIES: glucose PTS transporter subunit IIA [Actinomyces]BAW92948.1 phosphotransferase system, EIIC [Actinomyces sp. Chiba101]GAV94070.1 phosphotransferase system, EIIC [Actinomyces denticolens]SHI58554.1 PTS system, beta-glucosides-specific IIC component [Actinomyces denticolens]SUU06017.1 EIIBCA-Bgl [Actinomyces denticolens]